jgi:hypothetical protein
MRLFQESFKLRFSRCQFSSIISHDRSSMDDCHRGNACGQCRSCGAGSRSCARNRATVCAGGPVHVRGLIKNEGPANGAFQRTKVRRDRQSSGRGGQQLPVLGQNDCIDRVNNAVRRNDVRLGDMGPIDPYVR